MNSEKLQDKTNWIFTLIVLQAFFLRLYSVIRYSGGWLEWDSASQTKGAEVLQFMNHFTGHNLPIYVNGYGYGAFLTFLSDLTGISIITWQIYLHALIGIIPLIIAYPLIYELTKSKKVALFSIFLLSLIPDFLFPTTRFTHISLTLSMVLASLYFLLKSSLYNGFKSKYILISCLTIFALTSSNIFFALIFLSVLFSSLALNLIIFRKNQEFLKALSFGVLICSLFVFLQTKYIYPVSSYSLDIVKDIQTKGTKILLGKLKTHTPREYLALAPSWKPSPPEREPAVEELKVIEESPQIFKEEINLHSELISLKGILERKLKDSADEPNLDKILEETDERLELKEKLEKKIAEAPEIYLDEKRRTEILLGIIEEMLEKEETIVYEERISRPNLLNLINISQASVAGHLVKEKQEINLPQVTISKFQNTISKFSGLQIYLFLQSILFIIIPASIIKSLQLIKEYFKNKKISSNYIFLLLMYFCFGFSLLLAIFADRTGSPIGSNFELRLFTFAIFFSVPLASMLILNILEKSKELRYQKIILPAFIVLILIFSYNSLIKMSEEPLINTNWKYTTHQERLAVGWITSNLNLWHFWNGYQQRIMDSIIE